MLPDGAGLARFDELLSRGKRRLGSRDLVERELGVGDLLDAIRRANANEREINAALHALSRGFSSINRPRLAHAVAVFQRDVDLVRALDSAVLPRDRARARIASGSDRAAFAAAAEELEADGLLVSAARAFERAEAWARARALWSRLAGQLAGSPERYEASLAWLNVVRASLRLGDEREARRTAALVVENAEEAADGFLRTNERERAFDALDVLVALGRRTKVFEHALLGYVGRARILRQDRLTTFSTATFEEAIAHAREAGENTAAADLARELAQLARADGDRALYTRARRDEAESSRMAALEEGRAAGLVEPMLLSAARAYADCGHFRSVGSVYVELSRRAATAPRRSYFARAATRYDGRVDPPLSRSSALDARPAAADLHFVDLVEWEGRGSAAEAAAELLFDPACADLTRRRALSVQLAGLLAEPDLDTDARAGVALVGAIAQLEVYAMLSPLEHLARSPHRAVLRAVAGALGHFTFKRTFSTVRQLAGEPELQTKLADAVASLAFAHGIDPLLRLARTADGELARAALSALASIGHRDAGEALLDYLVAGGDAERQQLFTVLERTPSSSLRAAAKRAIDASDPTRARLAQQLVRA